MPGALPRKKETPSAPSAPPSWLDFVDPATKASIAVPAAAASSVIDWVQGLPKSISDFMEIAGVPLPGTPIGEGTTREQRLNALNVMLPETGSLPTAASRAMRTAAEIVKPSAVDDYLNAMFGVRPQRLNNLWRGTTGRNVEQIIEEGFRRGTNMELGLRGTPTTSNPSIALEFAGNQPRQVMRVVPKVDPAEVRNVSPEEYYSSSAISRNEKAFSLPNISYGEHEIFFSAPAEGGTKNAVPRRMNLQEYQALLRQTAPGGKNNLSNIPRFVENLKSPFVYPESNPPQTLLSLSKVPTELPVARRRLATIQQIPYPESSLWLLPAGDIFSTLWPNETQALSRIANAAKSVEMTYYDLQQAGKLNDAYRYMTSRLAQISKDLELLKGQISPVGAQVATATLQKLNNLLTRGVSSWDIATNVRQAGVQKNPLRLAKELEQELKPSTEVSQIVSNYEETPDWYDFMTPKQLAAYQSKMGGMALTAGGKNIVLLPNGGVSFELKGKHYTVFDHQDITRLAAQK